MQKLRLVAGQYYWEIRLCYYHAIGTIYAKLSGKERESCSYLKTCKGIHKGKRAFIIGNGPSLTVNDLEKISNEITFASNRIYKLFPNTSWRPTYYTMSDEGMLRDEEIIGNLDTFDCKMKFFRKEGCFRLRHLKKPMCLVHMWGSRKYLDKPNFSEDAEKGVYGIATVTYFAMQMAVHMGIREIYLLGIDHKYQKEQQRDGSIVVNGNIESYGWKSDASEKNVVGASWEMDVAYRFAKRYGDEKGIRIYNATRGGCLEAFPRVNLDEIVT